MDVRPTKETITAVYREVFDVMPSTSTQSNAAGVEGVVEHVDGRWHVRDADTHTCDRDVFRAVAEFFEERGCDVGTIARIGASLDRRLSASLDRRLSACDLRVGTEEQEDV